jgi:hypothetical protein
MTSKPMTGVPRKPLQIAISECAAGPSGTFSRVVVALCDDDTIWVYDWDAPQVWERLPPIPGDEP